MIQFWQRFLTNRESRYCSDKTLRYYRQAWDVWGKWLPATPADIDESTIEWIVASIRKMKKIQKPDEVLAAISVKTYLRALNVFLKYLRVPVKVDLRSIKTPKPNLHLFSEDQIHFLLHAQPVSRRERRILLALTVVADTALRATEALSIRWRDIDLNESLIVVMGKGQKARAVALGSLARKRLQRLQDELHPLPEEYLLPTRKGTPLSYRNSLRDLKQFCSRLKVQGPRISWHTIRHSFASNYIKRGGDVTLLQQVLGHSDLSMTQRYVHLQTADLRRVHDKYTMAR